MTLAITINLILAAIVFAGIVGMIARTILTSAPKTARRAFVPAAARPARRVGLGRLEAQA